MSLLQKGIDLFHKYIQNKFIRFILVGGLNTAFGLGVYCLMIWMGLSYVWATLISQILGILFNFITTGTLVFENNDKGLIFKFVFCYVLTYFFNVGINKTFQVIFDVNEYISGIGAIIISALISFFILKLFVYNAKSAERINNVINSI